MLPRKRQRPNPADSKSPADVPVTPRPQAATTSLAATTSEPALNETKQQMPPPKSSGARDLLASSNTPAKQIRKAQSWYGSWPRTPKASASTSVARENIFGGSVRSAKAPDLSKFDMKKDGDASSIHSTARSASGLTKIPEDKTNDDTQPTDQDKGANGGSNGDNQNATSETDKKDESTTNNDTDPTITTPQRPVTSSGWLGWWSKTPFTETQASSTTQIQQQQSDAPTENPHPSTPTAQTADAKNDQSETPREPSARPTSWFGLWGSSAPPSDKGNTTSENETGTEPMKGSEDVVMNDAPPPAQPDPEPAPKAGSTWAFWSKDSPKSKGVNHDKEEGQIAVIGEGSEAHPKPMTEGDVTPSKDAKAKKDAQAGKSTWRRSNKRLRPPSMDAEAPVSPSPSGTSTPQEKVSPQQQTQGQTPAKVDSSSKSITESESAPGAKANLLLPSFSSTYQMKQDPSILKQIAQLVLRTQQTPVNHVFRHKDPPKIRKAIAIGVHGLFPATYLRPMIGQPTGTSLRFASLGADAIRRWTDAHGSPNCEIEKVALEGEGKINERVDNLWKLMLNWMEHIRQADLILIACHSQGVPVSIMLLEKLIDLGIITNAKIGVCAMAGVALGPFPEYKSGILMGSAAELWDFGNTESANTLRFETSLKRVLDYGARITFIGSIDDQLVPMESAVYSPANHPYIYRAVFIDGRVHAPDFIAHLIGFALKLRNLGISDHGLIRELSVPLAGSLYSGEGHSRLYYDDQVYDLAVSHALETTSTSGGRGQQHPTCEIHHRGQGVVPGTQQSQQQSNPYVLPWIMRGLLEEDFVKTELSHETEELLRQFDDWKPSNKALKDVKYRLEAVRSKL